MMREPDHEPDDSRPIREQPPYKNNKPACLLKQTGLLLVLSEQLRHSQTGLSYDRAYIGKRIIHNSYLHKSPLYQLSRKLIARTVSADTAITSLKAHGRVSRANRKNDLLIGVEQVNTVLIQAYVQLIRAMYGNSYPISDRWLRRACAIGGH